MAEPYIGEIRMVGFNFAPQGWALCNGQLLAISQNTALFSLLGTFYGGDGRSTFGLPNLQGRFPMHFGQSPGTSLRYQGEMDGTETVTLLQTQMPAHTHLPNCVTGPGDQRGPSAALWAQEATGQTASYSDQPPNGTMSPQSIGIAGGSQPHPNMPPYLVVNFIIALQGIFPPRS